MLAIQLTEEQHARIAELARKHGYSNPTEYVLALVDAAEKDEDFIDDAEEAAIDPEVQFREAWHQAMTGQTMPARETLAQIRQELGLDDDES